MPKVKDINALLVQYNISVPEGTSEEVKEMLVQKHEEAMKAIEEKNSVEENAIKEIEKLEAALKEEQSQPKADGFGTFSIGANKYKITAGYFLAVKKGEEQPHKFTSADLLKDKDMQKQAVEEKWGIIEPVSSK